MRSCEILCLLIGLLCVNARCIKRQKIRQRPAISSRGCRSIIRAPCRSFEPTYNGFGTCYCQNELLNERVNGCGCKYVENYGVLSPEVSNYDRVSAIKLPKIIAKYDAVPISAVNFPGLYDIASCPCQAIPPFVMDLPCSCQTIPPYIKDLPSSCQTIPPYVMDFQCPCQAISPYLMDLPCPCQASLPPYQIIDTPCCRSMIGSPPIVDYLSPCDVPILTLPFVEPYYVPPLKYQPQIVQLPSCGSLLPQIECGCPKINSCACQKIITCDNGYKISYGLPCECQNPLNCGCENVIQLPAPCSCQLPAIELPVYGCGCQSLSPNEIGCGGKYLRQVTIPPPFL